MDNVETWKLRIGSTVTLGQETWCCKCGKEEAAEIGVHNVSRNLYYKAVEGILSCSCLFHLDTCAIFGSFCCPEWFPS